MASAINIVLNAVDNYSGALTGLNQGLELLSKGFGLVTDAAKFTFSAIGKGVEIARIGGAFDEQRNQFENLAKSYKVNGQQIIDAVQNISSNTVTELGAVRIATKAIAVGLQGPELQDALTYAKKWSESTGEAFEGVAERITSALGTGRYGALKQMGLFIEKGATLQDATRAMSEGLKRFGETGFNTADKLDSLSVAQEDFTRKVGQGVNQSKEFQSVLGSVSDAVFALVKNFNPAPITAFVDLLVKGAKSIGSAFLREFPTIGAGIDTLLNDTKGSVADLTNFIIDASFGVVRQVANAANLVIDILQGLNIGNIFSKAAQTISLVVGTMVEGVAKGISALINVVLTGFDNMILGVVQLAEKFPSISEALGVDSSELNGLADSMNSIRESVTGGLDSIGNSAFEAGKSVALGLDDFNKNAEKYKISLAGIEQAQADAKKTSEELLKGGTLEGGKVEVVLPETELDKLKNFKAELSTEINIGLDAGKGGAKAETSGGLDDSSVLAALVRILVSALSGAASAEGIPIAVSA